MTTEADIPEAVSHTKREVEAVTYLAAAVQLETTKELINSTLGTSEGGNFLEPFSAPPKVASEKVSSLENYQADETIQSEIEEQLQKGEQLESLEETRREENGAKVEEKITTAEQDDKIHATAEVTESIKEMAKTGLETTENMIAAEQHIEVFSDQQASIGECQAKEIKGVEGDENQETVENKSKETVKEDDKDKTSIPNASTTQNDEEETSKCRDAETEEVEKAGIEEKEEEKHNEATGTSSKVIIQDATESNEQEKDGASEKLNTAKESVLDVANGSSFLEKAVLASITSSGNVIIDEISEKDEPGFKKLELDVLAEQQQIAASEDNAITTACVKELSNGTGKEISKGQEDENDAVELKDEESITNINKEGYVNELCPECIHEDSTAALKFDEEKIAEESKTATLKANEDEAEKSKVEIVEESETVGASESISCEANKHVERADDVSLVKQEEVKEREAEDLVPIKASIEEDRVDTFSAHLAKDDERYAIEATEKEVKIESKGEETSEKSLQKDEAENTEKLDDTDSLRREVLETTVAGQETEQITEEFIYKSPSTENSKEYKEFSALEMAPLSTKTGEQKLEEHTISEPSSSLAEEETVKDSSNGDKNEETVLKQEKEDIKEQNGATELTEEKKPDTQPNKENFATTTTEHLKQNMVAEESKDTNDKVTEEEIQDKGVSINSSDSLPHGIVSEEIGLKEAELNNKDQVTCSDIDLEKKELTSNVDFEVQEEQKSSAEEGRVEKPAEEETKDKTPTPRIENEEKRTNNETTLDDIPEDNLQDSFILPSIKNEAIMTEESGKSEETLARNETHHENEDESVKPDDDVSKLETYDIVKKTKKEDAGTLKMEEATDFVYRDEVSNSEILKDEKLSFEVSASNTVDTCIDSEKPEVNTAIELEAKTNKNDEVPIKEVIVGVGTTPASSTIGKQDLGEQNISEISSLFLQEETVEISKDDNNEVPNLEVLKTTVAVQETEGHVLEEFTNKRPTEENMKEHKEFSALETAPLSTKTGEQNLEEQTILECSSSMAGKESVEDSSKGDENNATESKQEKESKNSEFKEQNVSTDMTEEKEVDDREEEILAEEGKETFVQNSLFVSETNEKVIEEEIEDRIVNEGIVSKKVEPDNKDQVAYSDITIEEKELTCNSGSEVQRIQKSSTEKSGEEITAITSESVEQKEDEIEDKTLTPRIETEEKIAKNELQKQSDGELNVSSEQIHDLNSSVFRGEGTLKTEEATDLAYKNKVSGSEILKDEKLSSEVSTIKAVDTCIESEKSEDSFKSEVCAAVVLEANTNKNDELTTQALETTKEGQETREIDSMKDYSPEFANGEQLVTVGVDTTPEITTGGQNLEELNISEISSSSLLKETIEESSKDEKNIVRNLESKLTNLYSKEQLEGTDLRGETKFQILEENKETNKEAPERETYTEEDNKVVGQDSSFLSNVSEKVIEEGEEKEPVVHNSKPLSDGLVSDESDLKGELEYKEQVKSFAIEPEEDGSSTNATFDVKPEESCSSEEINKEILLATNDHGEKIEAKVEESIDTITKQEEKATSNETSAVIVSEKAGLKNGKPEDEEQLKNLTIEHEERDSANSATFEVKTEEDFSTEEKRGEILTKANDHGEKIDDEAEESTETQIEVEERMSSTETSAGTKSEEAGLKNSKKEDVEQVETNTIEPEEKGSSSSATFDVKLEENSKIEEKRDILRGANDLKDKMEESIDTQPKEEEKRTSNEISSGTVVEETGLKNSEPEDNEQMKSYPVSLEEENSMSSNEFDAKAETSTKEKPEDILTASNDKGEEIEDKEEESIDTKIDNEENITSNEISAGIVIEETGLKSSVQGDEGQAKSYLIAPDGSSSGVRFDSKPDENASSDQNSMEILTAAYDGGEEIEKAEENIEEEKKTTTNETSSHDISDEVTKLAEERKLEILEDSAGPNKESNTTITEETLEGENLSEESNNVLLLDSSSAVEIFKKGIEAMVQDNDHVISNSSFDSTEISIEETGSKEAEPEVRISDIRPKEKGLESSADEQPEENTKKDVVLVGIEATSSNTNVGKQESGEQEISETSSSLPGGEKAQETLEDEKNVLTNLQEERKDTELDSKEQRDLTLEKIIQSYEDLNTARNIEAREEETRIEERNTIIVQDSASVSEVVEPEKDIREEMKEIEPTAYNSNSVSAETVSEEKDLKDDKQEERDEVKGYTIEPVQKDSTLEDNSSTKEKAEETQTAAKDPGEKIEDKVEESMDAKTVGKKITTSETTSLDIPEAHDHSVTEVVERLDETPAGEKVTNMTEEAKHDTLEDNAESNIELCTTITTEALEDKKIAEQNKETLVQTSSFVVDVSERVAEEKIQDKETVLTGIAAEEADLKEAEPENKEHIQNSEVGTEKKALATNEIPQEKDSMLEENEEEEILVVEAGSGEKIRHADKNIEASISGTEVEKIATELKAENIENNKIQRDKVLARSSESVNQDKIEETPPLSKELHTEPAPIEQQEVMQNFQGKFETETNLRLIVEDQISETESSNETIKAVILTEVTEEIEKANKSENIEEQVIDRESNLKEFQPVPTRDERTGETKEDTSKKGENFIRAITGLADVQPVNETANLFDISSEERNLDMLKCTTIVQRDGSLNLEESFSSLVSQHLNLDQKDIERDKVKVENLDEDQKTKKALDVEDIIETRPTPTVEKVEMDEIEGEIKESSTIESKLEMVNYQDLSTGTSEKQLQVQRPILCAEEREHETKTTIKELDKESTNKVDNKQGGDNIEVSSAKLKEELKVSELNMDKLSINETEEDVKCALEKDITKEVEKHDNENIKDSSATNLQKEKHKELKISEFNVEKLNTNEFEEDIRSASEKESTEEVEKQDNESIGDSSAVHLKKEEHKEFKDSELAVEKLGTNETEEGTKNAAETVSESHSQSTEAVSKDGEIITKQILLAETISTKQFQVSSSTFLPKEQEQGTLPVANIIDGENKKEVEKLESDEACKHKQEANALRVSEVVEEISGAADKTDALKEVSEKLVAEVSQMRKEEPKELKVSEVVSEISGAADETEKIKEVSETLPKSNSEAFEKVINEKITKDQTFPEEMSKEQLQENETSSMTQRTEENKKEVEVLGYESIVDDFSSKKAEEYISLQKEEPMEFKASEPTVPDQSSLSIEVLAGAHQVLPVDKDEIIIDQAFQSQKQLQLPVSTLLPEKQEHDSAAMVEKKAEDEIRAVVSPLESKKTAQVRREITETTNVDIISREIPSDFISENEGVSTKTDNLEVDKNHFEVAKRTEESQSELKAEANNTIKNEILDEEIKENKEVTNDSQQVTLGEVSVQQSHQEIDLQIEEHAGDKTDGTFKAAAHKNQQKELSEGDEKEAVSGNAKMLITSEASSVKELESLSMEKRSIEENSQVEAEAKSVKEEASNLDTESQKDEVKFEIKATEFTSTGEKETAETSPGKRTCDIKQPEKSSDATSEKQVAKEENIDVDSKATSCTTSAEKDGIPEPIEETKQRAEMKEPEPRKDKTEIKVGIEEVMSKSDETKLCLSQLMQSSTKESKEAEVEVEHLGDDEGEGEEHKGSTEQESDAPVIVEASRDADVKVAHKKSHNILSGVGSKVKYSISKVKKAITGKSSSSKQGNKKPEDPIPRS